MNKVSWLLCFVFCTISAVFAAESSAPQVRLLSERHRTEWNWVEYRITLTNSSKTAIKNPEIYYYAENSNIQYCEGRLNDALCASILNGGEARDSVLDVAVDWSSLFNPVEKSVESYGKMTVIKLGFKGTFYPGKNMYVNFRIFRKDWAKWDCSRDLSYQKTAEKLEPNYSMVVYDGDHNLLWGYNPFNGKSVADTFLWNDRGGVFAISKYNGDKSAVQKAGRFWMIKNSPLSGKENELLENIGVKRLTATAVNGKHAILFKSAKDVKKRVLDSLVYGFYDSFKADDSTKLKVEYEPNDWIGEKNVCDVNNNCHKVVWNKISIDMSTVCWEDISIGDCRKVVENCGGDRVRTESGLIWSKNTRNVNECLTEHKDVYALDVERPGIPNNNQGRKAVNIEKLQTDTWLNSLNINFTLDEEKNEVVTDDWLKNLKYTGEHVLAGVYDTGIYFDHNTFNEWKNGVKTPRKVEFANVPDCVPGECPTGKGDQWNHATHVAGILGGNGNGSKDQMYRGVAPKLKFYSGQMDFVNQVGQVANHSHVVTNGQGYASVVDKITFENGRTSKDSLPKTIVFGAGNEADGSDEPSCIYGVGFHSLSVNTKNGIVVGNYGSFSGIPHISSSYGPTWDGRIKPDVMAPGNGFMRVFDEDNVFVLFFEQVRIERNGVPYIDLNVGYNDKLGVNDNIEEPAANVANVFDAKCRKRVLQWNVDKPDLANYMNWKYQAFTDNPFSVQNGDKIIMRIRMDKKTRQMFVNDVIKGDVFFGTAPTDEGVKKAQEKNVVPGFYEGVYVKKEYEYSLVGIDDDYFTITIEWDKEPILASYFRFGFDLNQLNRNIISAVPCSREGGGTCYDEAGGTSIAAPYVSGIVALMNQAYNQTIGTEIDDNDIYKDGLRNSTSRAILIHTAHDMVDESGFVKSVAYDVSAVENKGLADNAKKTYYVTYGKGPDFVTGWGRVDGEAALRMFDDYDYNKKEFRRFREIEVGLGADKRFALNVGFRTRLRLTLTWDDYKGKELQNDLDMYLISPSGKYYFPWRLDPLSTDHLDENGNVSRAGCKAGLEYITEAEAKKPAYNDCSVNNVSDPDCFDHLNNVEVVDVDYPEMGVWTVVVRASNIELGNGLNGGQIASIASDVALDDNPGNIGCDANHPYLPQSRIQCSYYFGSSLENYVTFTPETSLGPGDFIKLYDAGWNEIGMYSGKQLSGVRMRIDSERLNVVLDSDNGEQTSDDYGFSIQRIETIPYSMLFGIGQ